MEDNFKLEIISPEKIIFSENVKMVTLPSYEGEMSILKHHISIITFLRPGIIKVDKNESKIDEFLVEDGTIEYFNDNLVVLTTLITNVKNLTKELEFPYKKMNTYEGPSGMLGVFTNHLIAKGIPHGAIWANIPYYLNSITNPKASQAILQSLVDLLDINCDMHDIGKLASKFDTYVESLLKDHPDISLINNKIKELEENTQSVFIGF